MQQEIHCFVLKVRVHQPEYSDEILSKRLKFLRDNETNNTGSLETNVLCTYCFIRFAIINKKKLDT